MEYTVSLVTLLSVYIDIYIWYKDFGKATERLGVRPRGYLLKSRISSDIYRIYV